MTMLPKLLAATDFSPGGRIAAMRAALQARPIQASLRLASVVEPDLLLTLRNLFASDSDLQQKVLEQAQLQLDAEAQLVASTHGLTPETQLLHGDAVEQLRRSAEDCGVLVVGAHGSHPVRAFTLGKTASRLARRAATPVLAVRGEPERPYQRVLVPIDFSDSSREALRVAMLLAPGASFQLLHCVDLPAEGRLRLAGANEGDLARYRLGLRLQAGEKLRRLADSVQAASRISSIVRDGDVRMELSNLVPQEQIDLVALGKQGSSVLVDTMLGSVSEWALEHSSCDVLVVPLGAVHAVT